MTDIRHADVVYVSTSKNGDYVSAADSEDAQAFVRSDLLRDVVAAAALLIKTVKWWEDHHQCCATATEEAEQEAAALLFQSVKVVDTIYPDERPPADTE